MTLVSAVRGFFDTPAGVAIILLFCLAALDFALGTFAALRDNVFQLESVGSWLRSNVAGKVLPAFAVLLAGYITGGMQLDGPGGLLSPGTILTTIGLGMAATYVLGVVGSLQESLIQKPGTRIVPQD